MGAVIVPEVSRRRCGRRAAADVFAIMSRGHMDRLGATQLDLLARHRARSLDVLLTASAAYRGRCPPARHAGWEGDPGPAARHARLRRDLGGGRGGRTPSARERHGRPQGLRLRGGGRVPRPRCSRCSGDGAFRSRRRRAAAPRPRHVRARSRAAHRAVVRAVVLRGHRGRATSRRGDRIRRPPSSRSSARGRQSRRSESRHAAPAGALRRRIRALTGDTGARRVARPAHPRSARRLGRAGEGDPSDARRALGGHAGARRSARPRPQHPADGGMEARSRRDRRTLRRSRRAAAGAPRARHPGRPLLVRHREPPCMASRARQRGIRPGRDLGDGRGRRAVGRPAPRAARSPGRGAVAAPHGDDRAVAARGERRRRDARHDRHPGGDARAAHAPRGDPPA